MCVKTQVFLIVTSFISFVGFNFNKILRIVLSLVCDNLYDQSVPTIGPYKTTVPISVISATIDGTDCTNKMRLIFNWYWDGDVNGIMLSQLPIDGNILEIRYTIKTAPSPADCDIVRICVIDLEKNKVNGRTVSFGELI